MKKATWFSRHQPTAGQLEDAARMGFDIEVSTKMTALASLNIETEYDVYNIVNALQDARASAIFGVFTTPVQARITAYARAEALDPAVIPPGFRVKWSRCFASWNISRSPEGGKPTFTHYKWVEVGKI